MFDNYIFTTFSKKETVLRSYNIAFLEKLGVPIERVKIVDKGAYLEHVFVPEQAWRINSLPHWELRSLYGRLRSCKYAPSGRRIFLSRKQIDFKRITNVQGVEDIFRKNGFEILYPEDLTIEDQLNIYGTVSVIAGMPGTALHNVLFSHPGTKLLEIGDSRSPNEFHRMQRYCNLLAQPIPLRIPFSGIATEYDLSYLEREVAGCRDFFSN